MATLPSELRAGRTDAFLLDPESLTLVADPESPLYDPRVHDAPDESLVLNVMAYGVLEPVIIRKNGSTVEVVAGRGRVKAAREANKRLSAEGKQPIRVPAILKRGPDADMYGVLISENELRRDDGPLLKAGKARRLHDLGKTTEEIAVTFGVARQTVENWLALEDVATPVRKAVEAGELSATAAMQLSNLDRQTQVKTLEKMKKEGGKVTVARTRRAVQTGDYAREQVTKGNKSRMRTRRELEWCLDKMRAQLSSVAMRPKGFNENQARGFCDALRWVLCLDEMEASDVVSNLPLPLNKEV